MKLESIFQDTTFKDLFFPKGINQCYPMNHTGSYLRLSSSSKVTKESLTKIKNILNTDQSLEEMKLKIVSSEYNSEWSQEETLILYDHDLSELSTAYGLGNIQIRDFFINELIPNHQKNELCIADIGVGTGGTILPILKYIDKNTKNKEISIHLIDTDIKKCLFVRSIINSNFFKNNYIIYTHHSHLDTSLRNLQLNNVDYIVSGATFCHSVNKESLFHTLSSWLNKKGYLIFWDACLPLEAPGITVNNENSWRYALFYSHVYPGQIGYKEGNIVFDKNTRSHYTISKEDEFKFVQEAYQYCSTEFSKNTFEFESFILWLYNQKFKDIKLNEQDKSKYFLFEAFEEKVIIEKHLSSSFSILQSSWLSNSRDVNITNFRDAAQSCCALFTAQKD